MGGIFEEEPTDIVCAVVCDGWNEGSYAYLTCLRNAEDCAQRKVDAAAIDVKISKDVVAAWEAAVTAASKEADAARLATNNAAYAADTANKYAINTKATAEAFAECSAFEACAELEGACCPDKEDEFLSCCSDGSEKEKQAALTAQKVADAARLASNTASATADAMLAVEKKADGAFDTATATANAAQIELAIKESELAVATAALNFAKTALKEFKFCGGSF